MTDDKQKSALEALATLDEIIYQGIEKRVFPGAVVGCGQPTMDGCLKYFAKGAGINPKVFLLRFHTNTQMS